LQSLRRCLSKHIDSKEKTEKTEVNLNPNHSQTRQTNKKERNKEKNTKHVAGNIGK